jgi:hypothetical protein
LIEFKKLKKESKKKLASHQSLSVNGDTTRQILPKAVQKTLRKVKKKLVSALKI